MLSRTFRMEVKYIQNLKQEMLDWKYVTVLSKQKMIEKKHNYHQRVQEKVNINSLSLM